MGILQDPELHRRVGLDCPELHMYVDPAALTHRGGLNAMGEEPDLHVPDDTPIAAAEMVRRLVRHDLQKTPVIVVGVGIGAYLALEYACALRHAGGFPWLLYAVRPPILFPARDPGA